jgi:hypothetical protein
MRQGLGLLLFLAGLLGPATGSRAGDEPFTALFSSSCVRHFYALDKLAAALASSQATALDGVDAAPFLGGASGAAWALRAPSGRYVVAIRTDRVCAVFAHRARATAVEESFAALATASPAPLVAEKLDSSAGPNDQTSRTLAWSWSRAGDGSSLVFALTTSTDPTATIQAMASISLASKPE